MYGYQRGKPPPNVPRKNGTKRRHQDSPYFAITKLPKTTIYESNSFVRKKIQSFRDKLRVFHWKYRCLGPKLEETFTGLPCDNCQKCTGFTAHQWRNKCTSCQCPKLSHVVDTECGARARIGLFANHDEERFKDYSWVPVGLDDKQVQKYFSSLNKADVPKFGSPGEQKRKQRLVIQLPKQDMAVDACKYLESGYIESYKDFIKMRNELALDIGKVELSTGKGIVCNLCRKSIPMKSMMVVATRFPSSHVWHPSCFRCSKCEDLLADLAYCNFENDLLCVRHYSERLKPRCFACDELIFSAEYTNAMEKDWHGQHFSCWQCDESLTGQRYVLRDEHPYCVKCYEQVFANTCEKCNRIIGIDSKDLSYKEKHWHETCFQCTTCGDSLVDKQFGAKGEKIYCGRCYDNQFASRCDGCGNIFHAGTKKMEYKNRQWHESCFCCCTCKTPIGTKSFIPREKDIYCASCYEEKFATRCIKCNKAIQSGGVTYKNEPWHRECFTCTHCNKNLAGQRFTSRDDKPCCADCFGKLFAKRCTACNEPITGIGGTRFISFEDRHWHNDCFTCASCSESLVGRGFITDNDKIICPECAKQRFM